MKSPKPSVGLGLRGKRSLWAQIGPSRVPLMMLIMGDGLRIITCSRLAQLNETSTALNHLDFLAPHKESLRKDGNQYQTETQECDYERKQERVLKDSVSQMPQV